MLHGTGSSAYNCPYQKYSKALATINACGMRESVQFWELNYPSCMLHTALRWLQLLWPRTYAH